MKQKINNHYKSKKNTIPVHGCLRANYPDNKDVKHTSDAGLALNSIYSWFGCNPITNLSNFPSECLLICTEIKQLQS